MSKKEINKYKNWIELLKLKNIKSLTGKGFSLQTEKEDLKTFWQEWSQEAKLHNFIDELVGTLSVEGKALVSFLEDGMDTKLFIVKKNNYVYNEIDNEPVSVHIIRYFKGWNLQGIFIKEVWTKDFVEFFYALDRNFKMPVPLSITGITFTLPNRYWKDGRGSTPLVKIKNKYGFIPFVLFKNYNDSDNPDVFPAREFIKGVYNPFAEKLIHEFNTGRTISVVNVPNALSRDNLIKSFKQGINSTNNMIINDNQSKNLEKNSLEYAQATSNDTSLIEGELKLTQQIFTLCGFTYQVVSPNATATDITINYSNQGLTILRKRTAFNYNMNFILRMVFQALNKSKNDSEWHFELNPNSAISPTNLLEIVERELNLGLLSRQEAIQKLRGVSAKEASQLVLSIDVERKKDAELLNEIQGTPMEPNDAGEGFTKNDK